MIKLSRTIETTESKKKKKDPDKSREGKITENQEISESCYEQRFSLNLRRTNFLNIHTHN